MGNIYGRISHSWSISRSNAADLSSCQTHSYIYASFLSPFWLCLHLDRSTFKFMVKGIMEGPGFTSLAHVKYQIQVDRNPGAWIWISPNGSHRSSRRATLWTGKSLLKAESREVRAPWSTNSWVVWFSCGILNLRPLPAERSKTFWKMSVNMWHWLLENSFNLRNITTNQSL